MKGLDMNVKLRRGRPLRIAKFKVGILKKKFTWESKYTVLFLIVISAYYNPR
jgi:hypothetical protein